jgi:hypothetical protein
MTKAKTLAAFVAVERAAVICQLGTDTCFAAHCEARR